MGSIDQSTLYSFLQRQRYAVVSSLAATGAPQSALVGIAVTSELEIVFDTLKTTRKYPNLIARPPCSMVIGWENELTLQFEGTAFEPEDTDLCRYQEIYFAAWPDGRDRASWLGITWMVVRPRWIRYSDFNQSPPLIAELEFPGQP
jgi:Pyridoxamine 5'-phosphate oxidase